MFKKTKSFNDVIIDGTLTVTELNVKDLSIDFEDINVDDLNVGGELIVVGNTTTNNILSNSNEILLNQNKTILTTEQVGIRAFINATVSRFFKFDVYYDVWMFSNSLSNNCISMYFTGGISVGQIPVVGNINGKMNYYSQFNYDIGTYQLNVNNIQCQYVKSLTGLALQCDSNNDGSNDSIYLKNGTGGNIAQFQENGTVSLNGNTTITGNLNINNGYLDVYVKEISTSDSPYNVGNESYIKANCDTGNIIINLPSGANNRIMIIKKVGLPDYLITINRNGTDTIEGENFIILNQFKVLNLVFATCCWMIISLVNLACQDLNMGFENYGENTTLTYTEPIAGDLKLTLSFTANCVVWGKRVHTFLASTSIFKQITPSSDGIQYFYLDDNFALQHSTTYPSFDHVFVSFCYWDHTNQIHLSSCKETHGSFGMSTKTHELNHKTVGFRMVGSLGNNFTLSTSIISINPTDDTVCRAYMESGSLWDEDLEHTIISTVSPSNPFEQDLGTALLSTNAGIFDVYYRLGTGTKWRKYNQLSTERYIFKKGSVYPQYNLNTGGTWSLADIGNNKYSSMFVIATNNEENPIILIMGQNVYSSIGELELNDLPSNLDLGPTSNLLPFPEMKVLFRIALYCRVSYTNSYKCKILRVSDYRSYIGNIVNNSFATPDHSSLISLDYDSSGHTNFQRQFFIKNTTANQYHDESDTNGVGVNFKVGDVFFNSTGGSIKICFDATTNNAIWYPLIFSDTVLTRIPDRVFMSNLTNGSDLAVNVDSSTGELYYVSSLLKHKENIEIFDIPTKKLFDLIKIKLYTRKNDPKKKPEIGIIADSFEDDLKQAELDEYKRLFLSYDKDDKVAGFRSNSLLMLTIDQIKELIKENTTQTHSLKILAEMMDEQEQNLKKIDDNNEILQQQNNHLLNVVKKQEKKIKKQDVKIISLENKINSLRENVISLLGSQKKILSNLEKI